MRYIWVGVGWMTKISLLFYFQKKIKRIVDLQVLSSSKTRRISSCWFQSHHVINRACMWNLIFMNSCWIFIPWTPCYQSCMCVVTTSRYQQCVYVINIVMIFWLLNCWNDWWLIRIGFIKYHDIYSFSSHSFFNVLSHLTVI